MLDPSFHIIGTACTWQSDIDQRYHTFTVAADWKPNPNVFDVRFELLYVMASEGNNTTRAPLPASSRAPRWEPTATVSAFYDDYHERGFGWGTGPGASLGFGAFEGALPRYPRNELPNWYGACANWGHYSAAGSGSAR